MGCIVIVLPKIEDGKKIGSLLERHGCQVSAVCTTASKALQEISSLPWGIVISSYRLKDMYYLQLLESLPPCFEMLLIGSAAMISDCPPGILCLSLPVRPYDLVNTVNMMLEQMGRRMRRDKSRPKPRDERGQNYIRNAKYLLMERNHMEEEDAFRYIQKCSMDSGTNMVETAQMILMMFWDKE